jgi:hypothetical protein
VAQVCLSGFCRHLHDDNPREIRRLVNMHLLQLSIIEVPSPDSSLGDVWKLMEDSLIWLVFMEWRWHGQLNELIRYEVCYWATV